MYFWVATFWIIIAASIIRPSSGEYYILSFKHNKLITPTLKKKRALSGHSQYGRGHKLI